MGMFGHGGGFSKVWHKTEHATSKTGQISKDIWTHGGREGLLTAGVIAGTVFTGGALAGGLAGGTAALTGTAITGSLLAGGYMGYSSADAHHEAQKLAKQAVQEQIEIDKENAKADAQRRANLLSLRKQVGAVNVGAKSTVFSGGSETDKNTATGIVLG